MTTPVRVLFVSAAGCPTCALWTPPFLEVGRRHPEWNATKVDVDAPEAKSYEALVTATPTFRVEGALEGCAPMFTSDDLKADYPNADALEQHLSRMIAGLQASRACPRGARIVQRPVARK